MTPALTPATEQDADIIASLQAGSFQGAWDEPPWTVDVWADLISKGTVTVWIVKSDDETCGYIAFQDSGFSAEIVSICIHPKWRRRGLAAAMFQQLMQVISTESVNNLTLEVAERNIAATQFYRKIGFEPVGRRKAYYGKGEHREDAIVMRFNVGLH